MRTLSLLVLFVLFSSSSMAWDISGNVSGPGGAVVGSEVQVHDTGGAYVTHTTTDGAGNYTITGLSDGDYYILTPVQTLSDPTLLPEIYDGVNGIYCANCDVANVGASLISILGADVSGIHFVLDQAGYISGTVETSGAVAVDNGGITALDVNGTWIGSTNPDGSGNWFLPLPDDTYWVEAEAYGAFEYYISQFHDGTECPWQWCGPQDIMAGIAVSVGSHDVVNYALNEGVKLSGTVTDSDSALPIESVDMGFFVVFDQILGMPTDVNGYYETPALPTDSYYIVAWAQHLGYVSENFDNQQCPGNACDKVGGSATPTTPPTGTTGTADFALEAGFRFTGTIDDEQGPAGNGYVDVYKADSTFLESVWPDGSGYYETSYYPPGNYIAYAWGEDFGHVTEVYNGHSCPFATCDYLAIGDVIDLNSSDQAGINFTLTEQSWDWTISGHITTTGSGAEQGGAVRLFDAAGDHMGDFWIDENGYWESDQLPNGVYFAQTVHTEGVMDEIWDWATGTACPNQTCDPLTGGGITLDGGNITDFDFELDPTSGGTISGIVVDESDNPLEYVQIQLFNSNGQHLTSACLVMTQTGLPAMPPRRQSPGPICLLTISSWRSRHST